MNINKQKNYFSNELIDFLNNPDISTQISDSDKKALEIALNNLKDDEPFFTKDSIQIINSLYERTVKELPIHKQDLFKKSVNKIFSQIVQKSDKFQEMVDQLVVSLREGKAFEAADSLESIRDADFFEKEQNLLELMQEPKILLSIIEHGDLAIVSFLIDYMNIDLDTFDSTKKTPLLHLLSRPNNEPATVQTVLRRLIQLGADVNRADRSGKTPLHYAVLGKNLEATKMLYDAGADPYVLDENDYNPIECAFNSSLDPNPALIFLLTKILNANSTESNLDIKESSTTSLLTSLNTANLAKKYHHLGSQFYNYMRNLFIDEIWLTQAEIDNLKIQELIDSYENEVQNFMNDAISVPLCMLYFQKFANKKQGFEEVINGKKEEIAVLEQLIEQTPDILIKKRLVLEKEKKSKELTNTLLQMKNELNITKAQAIKNSIRTGMKAASSLSSYLDISSEENRNLFLKALGSTAVGLSSSLSVYQNWNEIQDIERKVEQLALTKIDLMTNYNGLKKSFLELPSGLQATLASLKLLQLKEKMAHIESQLGELAAYKSAVKYSTIGHYSALILLTATTIYGTPLAVSSAASMLNSASTFAPLVVSGSYAAMKNFQKWQEITSDSLLSTISKCRSFYQKLGGIVKTSSLDQQEKASWEESSNVVLKQKVARNLGISIDKLEKQLNNLNTFLSNDLAHVENHAFMRQVLEESGIDTRYYDSEREKLILMFLSK